MDFRPSNTGTYHDASCRAAISGSPDDRHDPESLVEDLINQVTQRRTGAEADTNVILDIAIDGVRCLLVLPDDPTQARLSPREREIARMVAQGYPNKTIAATLHISAYTVSTHLRRIFAKLGVNSRSAMVAQLAQQYGAL